MLQESAVEVRLSKQKSCLQSRLSVANFIYGNGDILQDVLPFSVGPDVGLFFYWIQNTDFLEGNRCFFSAVQ